MEDKLHVQHLDTLYLAVISLKPFYTIAMLIRSYF